MVEKIREMKGSNKFKGIPFDKLEKKLKKLQMADDMSMHATRDVIVDFFEGLTVGKGGRKKKS